MGEERGREEREEDEYLFFSGSRSPRNRVCYYP